MCLEKPKLYNTPQSLHFQPKSVWFKAIVKYGTSPMHFKMRCMEGLSNASRAKKLIIEQRTMHTVYSDEHKKERVKDIKEMDQQMFIDHIGGLRIDFPDKKVSSSTV